MKDNNLMLGYQSIKELCFTAFGLKNAAANIIASFFGGLTTFITAYIYNDAHAIYVLIGFIFLDSLTGILKAIKNKKFSSSKLPRILVIMIIYVSLLSLGWNLSKINDLFSWVPGTLYFGFITTLCVSIIENLHELGIISDAHHGYIKKKLALVQEFFFGAKKKERSPRKPSN